MLALGAFASCSSDLEESALNGREGMVELTVQLPSTMSTRAFNQGESANSLNYYVYEAGTTKLIEKSEKPVDITSNTATIKLQLANGKSYDIVCWADAGTASPYSYNTETQEITVDYDNLNGSDDTRDAFYATKTIAVNGPVSGKIDLYRPFAQINLGTDDLDVAAIVKEYGEEGANLGVELNTTVATTLNLVTGKVGKETKEVVFKNARVETCKGNAFPYTPANGKEYSYINMNYVLVPADNSIMDFEYTFYNADKANDVKLPVTNVPVKANYQTNIFGSLLTSPATLEVNIVADFAGDGILYPVTPVSTTKELMNALKDGGSVLLTKDITVKNKEQAGTLIGSSDRETTVLDLGGKTLTLNLIGFIPNKGAKVIVKNGKIAGPTQSQFMFSNGYSEGATLVLDNVELQTSTYQPIGIGASDCTLEIKNSKISGPWYAVSTSAANKDTGLTMTLENSTFSTTGDGNEHPCAFMANLGGSTIKATNCTFNSPLHPVFVRCGTAEFVNCKMNATIGSITEATANKYLNGWKSGCDVATAVLLVGNKTENDATPTAYADNADVTLTNCTLTIDNVAYPLVAAYGNQGYSAKVTVDAATKANSTANGIIKAFNNYASIVEK